MAEDEESESEHAKIVEWRDEKNLFKLGDFGLIIGGPHSWQKGRIAEFYEDKIALVELASKKRVKVKLDDFELLRDRPPH